MTQEEFYKKCAEILGVEIPYREIVLCPKVDWETGTFVHRYTAGGRWSGRNPGNGRIPGYGLIRWFSNKQIHVCLNHPIHVSKMFDSPEGVLEYLKEHILYKV